MQGQNIYHSEFSQLVENPEERAPSGLSRNLPRIGRAGISIVFPPKKGENFLQLLTCELELKREFLSPPQPVCYLRLRGFPLRQCTVEQITELLFRLCSKYRVQEGELGERKIDLSVEQCSSNHLALLKGLGFSHIRVFIDASIAAADRSLDAVKSAVATIKGFSFREIGCEIVYSADTSRDYLKNLVQYLFESQLDEIEFFRNDSTPSLPKELQLKQQTFKFLSETLNAQGYRLVGDRCFKASDHPDLLLLKEGKLGYGPWGFYNLGATEWLGLGPGAEGMVGGYLYQNTVDLEDFENSVKSDKSPVCSWSRQPMIEEEAFRFIQDLYCAHRVPNQFFIGHKPLLEKFKTLKWFEEAASYCTLTDEGILHLPTICNLYSLHRSMENKS